jgi:very-short-patch-repair endonuclease
MRASQYDTQQILAADGVIALRRHPDLRGAIEWRVRTGELAAVLPGVYAPADQARSARTLMAAVGVWDDTAVLTHEAAAASSFWPELAVPVVRCTVRHERTARSGFEFTRDRIPPELIRTRPGRRFTSPALTALDLCSSLGGDAIDHALRTRATTLQLMHAALAMTAGRHGNPRRRELLLDSRDEPWSAAERQFHRLLRTARITGWTANSPILLDDGDVFPDVAFRRQRLVVEIDGRRFHSGSDVFESDRKRQNLLVLDGWRVLRITWRMIQEEPDQVIALVREALALARPAQRISPRRAGRS